MERWAPCLPEYCTVLSTWTSEKHHCTVLCTHPLLSQLSLHPLLLTFISAVSSHFLLDHGSLFFQRHFPGHAHLLYSFSICFLPRLFISLSLRAELSLSFHPSVRLCSSHPFLPPSISFIALFVASSLSGTNSLTSSLALSFFVFLPPSCLF